MIKYLNSLNLKEETKTLVIGVTQKNQREELKDILTKLNEHKNIYEACEVTVYYPLSDFQTKRFVFVGLGEDDYDLDDVRVVFSLVAEEITDDTIIDFDSFRVLHDDVKLLSEIASETLGLVNYKFPDYKTDKKAEKEPEVYFYSEIDITEGITAGNINAIATNHARTLVNEPRNKLTPSLLAEYAVNLAKELNIDYKIYNKKEIEELKMGAFLAVNQGSKEEAKLIHLKYRNNDSDEIITLIGKGLTYDSGGYSIKPKTGMVNMKTDMGGAAAVLGAIEIIARKKLPVNVDVVIAATENLINSEAIVPDDVVVSMSGKTIEITNTDAEGRLTLVDAVTYARKHNATKIIDIATLTGGVITALGTDITGIFTNNKDFLNEVVEASKLTGEAVWELPVDPFRAGCRKSKVADYNNSPGRDGHASFGAAFIAEFAEDTPWIHLDIAGTCYKEVPHKLGPVGATGVMVRTLAKYLEMKKGSTLL